MKKQIIGLCAVVSALPLLAQIKLGCPFTDGAVLQRGMKVPVWGDFGSCEKPCRVKVEFAGQTKIADVAPDGKWKVELDAMEASKESRTMIVGKMKSGSDSVCESVKVKDVLVGEVWFASGQSNMETPIWGPGSRYRDKNGALMTTMTRLPFIRYAKSAHCYSRTKVDLTAKWCKFTPEYLQIHDRADAGLKGTGTRLSAVAFYYARELYLALDIPVGIVDASVGGTNIDAWTPRSGYENCDPLIKDTAGYPVKDRDKWNPKTDRKCYVSSAIQQPTVLFNGMVAAYAPMAMRGMIWYQGCHNNAESFRYCAKLHALYNGWSREFANPDLKLYLVQLAPFNHNWLGICMAQTRFCAEQKNAALAVTADVGNFHDIHPNDKEIVAKRLVVHALKRDYAFAIPQTDSPVFKSADFKDGKAVLEFDNVKNWYVYADNRSRAAAFELAGEDGKWHPAVIDNFRKWKDRKGNLSDSDFIDGAKIVLVSKNVPAPVKARYMGAPRTSGTVYNEASLPLGPFETGTLSGR